MRRLDLAVVGLAAVIGIGTSPLQAQGTSSIRGRVTVTSSQQGIAGVLVVFGKRSTVTREDGAYSFVVPPGSDTLRARLLGYAPVNRAVNVSPGQTVTEDFTMNVVAVNLAEVVSTGYGTQRAGSVTGAVTKVSSDEFNTGRIVSPQQLIESKVAGVQVIDNNEPGGGLSVRIRGATSINASSDPLYVVDGLPVGVGGGISAGRDPLNFLNPNDIESITVLKGGEAASIYGANAANGVVIIQTKTGKQGTTQVEYSSSVSGSQVTRLPSMLTASQFAAAVTQYAPQNVKQLQNSNTDWFSLVDRTGIGQTHDLSFSGAGQSSNYRLSLGYLNQDGIIKGTNTQRVSLGLNYGQRLLNDHLDVRTNLQGARSVDQFTLGGLLADAAQMGPTQPVMDPTSTTGFYNWPGNSLQSADNPLEILALGTDHGTTYRSAGNIQASYRLPYRSCPRRERPTTVARLRPPHRCCWPRST
ncbi:MAG: TonB-dependent receptor plug domain-containing protein [bacterium]